MNEMDNEGVRATNEGMQKFESSSSNFCIPSLVALVKYKKGEEGGELEAQYVTETDNFLK